MTWQSGKQTILFIGLLAGCTVAPEFCGPALIASIATSFAAYLDNHQDPARTDITVPAPLPENPTELDLIRQAYTMDIPRMNAEGKWVYNGKVIEPTPKPPEPKVLPCSSCGKDVIISEKYRRAKGAVCYECATNNE